MVILHRTFVTILVIEDQKSRHSRRAHSPRGHEGFSCQGPGWLRGAKRAMGTRMNDSLLSINFRYFRRNISTFSHLTLKTE